MNTVILDTVIRLADRHATTWRDEPETYWLIRLVAETGELAESLRGKHKHSPDLELAQIAAICLNWLDYRKGVNSK